MEPGITEKDPYPACRTMMHICKKSEAAIMNMKNWYAFQIIIAAFTILTVTTIHSVSGFNHPEINWRTVTSDHFAVHFYDNTEPFVSPAIAIAEEVYPGLNEAYGFFTTKKIDIVLADYDDYTNGFADWLGGGVMIWTPDGAFSFRGNTTWLRNVLTHELTHIITMRKAQGMQMVDFNVSATILRPGLMGQAGRAMPAMNIFPNWFAEGLAQIGAFRNQCDCWDSRRDMLLRCAALDGTLLSLDQMGVFTHDQLGNEMVYNQGFSLAMHIEMQVGSEEIHRVLRQENGPWRAFAAFDAAAASSFNGRRVEAFYGEWRDSVLQEARRAIPLQPTQTHIVWQNGRIQAQPRSTANGRYRGWLTSNGDDANRTDLIIFRKNGTRPVRTIKHAESSWDFSASGDAVFYVSSYYPGENGSLFKELYRCDLGTGKTERLTRNGRVYAIAASPSGSELAVVRFKGDRFSLERYDLANRVFTVIDNGNPGDPFISLDYDPKNGSHVIVERAVSGRSALYRVDLEKNTTVRISSGTGQEQAPCWAPDNRIYFSADYDGINNIYSVLPDGADLLRYTSVIGGAFDPQTDEAAQTLCFSEYTSAGFRIVKTPLAGNSYAIPRIRHCAFLPLAAYKGELSAARPYGLRMLRAYWESKLAYTSDTRAADSWLLDLGMTRVQNDALNRFYLFTGADVAAEGVTGQSALNGVNKRPLTTKLLREHGERFKQWVRSIDSSAAIPYTRVDRLQRLVQPALPKVASHSSESDNNGTSAGPAFLIVPQVGIASTALAPTIQAAAMLQTVSFVPTIMSTQIDIAQQTSRATNIGCSFVSELIIPKLLSSSMRESDTAMRAIDDSLKIAPAGAALPLWFGWEDMGYYNEDINYNGNGLWSAKVQVTPSYMISLVDSNEELNYSRAVKGISGMVEFFHGFPVTNYSGIPLSLSAGMYYYDFPVNGTRLETFDLEGNSNFYVTASSALSYTFPLIRRIDTGRRIFFDALYGRIGYNLSAMANREFLIKVQEQGDDWKQFLGRSMTTYNADSGLYVSHQIFLGGTINTVSDFIFSGGINVIVAYDILSKGTGLLLSGMF
jgi:hypothetical protein